MKKVLVCVSFKTKNNYKALEKELLTKLSGIGCVLYEKHDLAYNKGIFYCFNCLDINIVFDTDFYLDYMTLYKTYRDIRVYDNNELSLENIEYIVEDINKYIIDSKNIEAATKTLFINLPDKFMHSENIEKHIEAITKIAELKFGCPLKTICTKPKDGPYENKINNDIWKLGKYIEELSSADYYAGFYQFQKTRIYELIDDVASDFNIPKLEIPYAMKNIF